MSDNNDDDLVTLLGAETAEDLKQKIQEYVTQALAELLGDPEELPSATHRHDRGVEVDDDTRERDALRRESCAR